MEKFKENVKDGVEFISTGWRLMISIVMATVWITGFLYDIKLKVENLSGKVDAYHSMVQIVSNQNDRIEELARQHSLKGGHEPMLERMKAIERRMEKVEK